MTVALDIPRLYAVHARLTRLGQRSPDLLLASGLDELLPLLEPLLHRLPALLAAEQQLQRQPPRHTQH